MVKLSEHAILDKIAKHVNIQVYDRDGGTSSPRIRLELRTKGMDASLIEEVMAVQTPCVRCGKPVSPFRKRATRTGGAGRVDGLQGHVYIAIACPLKDNYGCCRGAEADHEYVAIRERVCAILGVDPGSYSTKRTTTGRTRSRKTTNEEKAADPSPPVHNVQQETVRGSDPETTEISKHLDELQDEWNKGCSCRCGACSLFDGRLIEIVDTILRLPAEANNTAICLGSFALEWVQACECSCDACSKLSEGIENVIARLQAYADKPKSVDGRDVAPVPDPYGDFAKMKQDVDGYIAGDTGPVAPAPQAVPTPPPSNAREQRVIEAAKELEQYSATHGGWIEISSVEPHVAAKALELVQAVVAAVRALDGMEARVEYGKSRPPCLEEYCDGACSDYCALHAGHEGTHVAHNGAVRWATGGKAERCIRTQDGVRCALPGGHDFACDFTRTKKEGESNCHYQGEMT